MGVASLPPSLIPAVLIMGILHHKKAKLPKHLQHSVHAAKTSSTFPSHIRMIQIWNLIAIPIVKHPFTMIGNGKFEPFTIWNDVELRYWITAS